MPFTQPGEDWVDWLADNPGADDITKLTALRETIFFTARELVGTERGLTAEWMNKKLASLGITERIDGLNTYTIETDVTGTYSVEVVAANRAEALDKFVRSLSTPVLVNDANAPYAMNFTAGPEDPIPGAVDPDAPTTIGDTLDKLREVITYGHIAGPKYCEDGANGVLDRFGLGPIPSQQSYTVSRAVAATMSTTVLAYDEHSARTVAEWRWENNRAGHQVTTASTVGDMVDVEQN